MAHSARSRCAGAVLLEVVLALVLFVSAATVITSGLSASVHEVEMLRLNAQANNLAVSIISEMQMGIRTVEASGPNNFDPPFDSWNWQATVGPIAAGAGDVSTIQKVEVVIRHKSASAVCRLTEFLPANAGTTLKLSQVPGADSIL